MRPTISIIFFTTASGAGYGLLALAASLAGLGLLPPERWFGGVTLALGLGLVTAGLLSSTFHLGHPERAWRALSQWRTSWLSREGVAAIAAYPPLLLFAFGWVVQGQHGGAWGAFGWLGALLAALTVLCTGQIYATLRAVPEWHHPWVTPNYLLLALAGGAVWLNAIAHLFAAAGPALSGLAGISIALAWAGKQQYWRSIRRAPATATAESATGLGGIGKVRLLEPPHTGENYLLHEMGFRVAGGSFDRVARRHADRLRRIAAGAGFVLPFALTVAATWLSPAGAGTAAVLAALSMSLGLVVERWLFFAEARHTVQLYYGASAV